MQRIIHMNENAQLILDFFIKHLISKP